MEFFNAKRIADNLDWRDCVEALREMFATGCEAPVRHHHAMAIPGQQEATMLLMPAWLPGRYAGLKLVNVYPDNPQKGLPTIMGNYLLMDGGSGAPIALMDGGELTARRTAAASALAADYLSPKNAGKLLIVGSGRLAGYLGFAHGAVRELKKIRIWARDDRKVEAVAHQYREAGLNAKSANNLEEAVGWADIISCATMSAAPLILGKWLRAGVHLDLIGSFRPTLRETDDEAVSRAEVFVDTYEGAMAEAGDLLIPLQNDSFKKDDIRADLHELTTGGHPGRRDEEEITLFKSVGASLEDLAAAIRCFENWQKSST